MIRYFFPESPIFSKPNPDSGDKFSKIRLTFALEKARSEALPLKMRSELFLLRSSFKDCSPKTHFTASTTFDLPDPLGPTIATMGEEKSKTTFFAKDLKPEISSRSKRVNPISLF